MRTSDVFAGVSPFAARRVFSGRALLVGAAFSFGVLILQVLDLATACFQRTLNSDYLLAHVITREFTGGAYPISGWKFGMGTFLFPDYALYLPWYAAAGDSGRSYAGYAATLWAAYALAFAALLRVTGATWRGALFASALGMNLVLALRHGGEAYADRLWQLSLPAYHGGNLVSELLALALVAGAVRAGEWRGWRAPALAALVAAGTLSNAQLVLHVVIPVGLLLFWSARASAPAGRPGARRAVAVGFARAALAGLGAAVAVRLALWLAEVFFCARLFKAFPLPGPIWRCFVRFCSDFREHLGPGLPAVWAIALVAAGAAVVLVRRARGRGAEAFVPCAFAVVLAATVATPVLAMYWKDVFSFRYMLAWLVLPACLLTYGAMRLPPAWRRGAAVAGLLAVVASAVPAVSRLDRRAWLFPHTDGAAALRDYLRGNGLRSGLCHFWQNYALQSDWGFDGPRLSNIRDEDFCEFWCNNALAYFPLRDGAYAAPEFDFVLLNGLDADVLAQRLGGRFDPVEVGPYRVVRLTPGQAAAASALVRRQALDFLEGGRARRVESDLREGAGRR